MTVAVVRYVSLGRPRIGVTSTYTAERLQARPWAELWCRGDLPVEACAPHWLGHCWAAWRMEGCLLLRLQCTPD